MLIILVRHSTIEDLSLWVGTAVPSVIFDVNSTDGQILTEPAMAAMGLHGTPWDQAKITIVIMISFALNESFLFVMVYHSNP